CPFSTTREFRRQSLRVRVRPPLSRYRPGARYARSIRSCSLLPPLSVLPNYLSLESESRRALTLWWSAQRPETWNATIQPRRFRSVKRVSVPPNCNRRTLRRHERARAESCSVLDELARPRFRLHRLGRRRLRACCSADVFVRQRDRLASQRDFQHPVDPFDRNDFDPVLHVVWNFGQILHVFLRDQHGLDAPAQRRQQFFLQSAD